MRRLSYFAGMLFVGMLTVGLLWGCKAEQADRSATKSPPPPQQEAFNASQETARPDRPQPAPALPPADEPMKPIYAKSLINEPAPEFVVEKWLTKEPDRAGKMVLIDFWATWCRPCLKAIPELNQFHRKHKDRLVVVGISNESEDEVRNHRKPRINYAIAIDPQSRMMNALEIESIPHVIVVDPTGVVRWEGLPMQPGHELTEEVIEDLLDTYVP